jgi:septal ring factor EnvC (AmiA/AmiB activator)
MKKILVLLGLVALVIYGITQLNFKKIGLDEDAVNKVNQPDYITGQGENETDEDINSEKEMIKQQIRDLEDEHKSVMREFLEVKMDKYTSKDTIKEYRDELKRIWDQIISEKKKLSKLR